MYPHQHNLRVAKYNILAYVAEAVAKVVHFVVIATVRAGVCVKGHHENEEADIAQDCFVNRGCCRTLQHDLEVEVAATAELKSVCVGRPHLVAHSSTSSGEGM